MILPSEAQNLHSIFVRPEYENIKLTKVWEEEEKNKSINIMMARWKKFIKKIERSIQMMRMESISIMDIDHDTTALLLALLIISHHMNLNVSSLFSYVRFLRRLFCYKMIWARQIVASTMNCSIVSQRGGRENDLKIAQANTWREHKRYWVNFLSNYINLWRYLTWTQLKQRTSMRWTWENWKYFLPHRQSMREV